MRPRSAHLIVSGALSAGLWKASALLAGPAFAQSIAVDPADIDVVPGSVFTFDVVADPFGEPGLSSFAFEVDINGSGFVPFTEGNIDKASASNELQCASVATDSDPLATDDGSSVNLRSAVGTLLRASGGAILCPLAGSNSASPFAYNCGIGGFPPAVTPPQSGGKLLTIACYAGEGLSTGQTFAVAVRGIDGDPEHLFGFGQDAGVTAGFSGGTIRTIPADRRPVLQALTDVSLSEGESATVPLSASDPEGQTLVLTAPLPGFAQLTDNGDGTGSIAINPGFADSGVYPVTVTARDTDNETDTQSFTITVLNVNRAPVLAGASQTVDENSSGAITVTVTDADGDIALLTDSGTPSFAAFTDNGDNTGELTFSPGFDDAGIYDVTITADDGQTTSQLIVTLTVNDVNRLPEIRYVGDRAVAEGGSLAAVIEVSDPDGDGVNLTPSGVPSFASLGVLSGGSASFAAAPGFDDAGTYPISFTATDTKNAEAVVAIDLEVTNTNREPVFGTLPSGAFTVGVERTLQISASDPDGDNVTLAAGDLPTGAEFRAVPESNAVATITWTPSATQANDTFPTLLTATDDGAPVLAETTTFVLSTGDVNLPPVLAAIGPQTIEVGDTLSLTLTATDPDGNLPLTFTDDNRPQGASFTDNNDGTATFSFTPTASQTGVFMPRFIVTDAGRPPQSDDETVSITVGGGNTPPVLTAIGNQSVDQNQELVVLVSATDPEGGPLTLTAAPLIPGMDFQDNGDGTGRFTFRPSFDQEGNVEVLFEVEDSGEPPLIDTELVQIAIGDVNRPPVLAETGVVDFDAGVRKSINVSATDPDGDNLTFSAINLPPGASLTASGNTATITWEPGFNEVGNAVFTLVVTDDGTPSLTDQDEITFSVGAVNRAPTLAFIPDQLGTAGETLSFSISGEDVDGDTITFAATSMPEGATLTDKGTMAQFLWFSPVAGQYTVRFFATDDGEPPLSDSQQVIIDISDPVLLPPERPTGLQASTSGTRAVLRWGGGERAERYDVYRDDEKIGETTSRSYSDFVPNGTTQARYFVVAVNSAGASAPSDTLIVRFSSRSRR